MTKTKKITNSVDTPFCATTGNQPQQTQKKHYGFQACFCIHLFLLIKKITICQCHSPAMTKFQFNENNLIGVPISRRVVLPIVLSFA